MAEIKLSSAGDHIALVDDDLFDALSKHRWHVLKAKRSLTFYARTSIKGRTVYLHRFVMNPPAGMEVDHIYGNGLNNLRANLRLLTHRENVDAAVTRRLYDAWKEARNARRLETDCKPPEQPSAKSL